GWAQVNRDGDGRGLVGGDGAFLDAGDLDHVELGLLKAVAVGLGNDLLFKFVTDLLAVALDDEVGGGLAGTEAGDAGDLGDFPHDGLVLGGDFGLVKGDHEGFAGFGDV